MDRIGDDKLAKRADAQKVVGKARARMRLEDCIERYMERKIYKNIKYSRC